MTIDFETLFDLSKKCVDALDVLKDGGSVEINKIIFERGDEETIIILTEGLEQLGE